MSSDIEEIQLSFGDWLAITTEGLFRVNKTQYYNPRYYNLIPSNDTQKALIERLQPPRETPTPKPKPRAKPVHTSELDRELNQLVTIDRLKKKLITHTNAFDRYKYLTDDDKLIKQRSITKAKQIIKKYLDELRADVNFNIKRLDKAIISLNYLGKYASCKRVVSF